MPLAFESVNRGTVAFGFFHIDSDMLLLQQSFFFADAFCEAVGHVATLGAGDAIDASWPGYVIERPQDVGDLMGAIHGERFGGFLGDAYRCRPFPAAPEDFKQKPEGKETQAAFRALIEPYAKPCAIRLTGGGGASEVSLGDLTFTREVFHELIRYVWRGGWPRWRDEVRPAYVEALRADIEASPHPLLHGLDLD